MKTTSMKKSIATAAASVLLTCGLVTVAAPRAAVASLACTASLITINAGAGAEAQSRVKGHTHATGNHYVGSISGGYWYWWADNNGGLNGDTWDTFYGSLKC